jgi:hypothetical protein
LAPRHHRKESGIVDSLLTALIYIVVGLILAFLGRRFFWLFAGLVGLVAGIAIVRAIAGVTSSVFALAVGVGLAIILGLSARSLGRIVVLAVGFLLGAIIAAELLNPLGITAEWLRLLIIVGGGLLGGLALRYFFSAAVIILSALAGGVLVGDGVTQLWAGAPDFLLWVLFAVVAIVGAVYQWNALKDVPEPDGAS